MEEESEVMAAGRSYRVRSLEYAILNLWTTRGSSVFRRRQWAGMEGGLLEPKIASSERSAQRCLWSESKI